MDTLNTPPVPPVPRVPGPNTPALTPLRGLTLFHVRAPRDHANDFDGLVTLTVGKHREYYAYAADGTSMLPAHAAEEAIRRGGTLVCEVRDKNRPGQPGYDPAYPTGYDPAWRYTNVPGTAGYDPNLPTVR